MSPGNFDPALAQVLAQTAFKAIPRPPSKSPLEIVLRHRADRFLRQEMVMEPRGRRIPWWDKPGAGSVANLQGGIRPAYVSLTGAKNGTDTAKLKRK